MTIWNMEITASESPQTVHIPIEGKYYAIKNTGDHDILVSSYVVNPTEGADDVMKIPSGSAAVIPVKDGDLYVSAEEDGTYSVSIQDDKVIPWGGDTGSGGGSGDSTHYKGTTTTALENGSTTNPIVIDGESYTAVFGDVVVYGYTEFVFDGTAWSEFGRPFDTTPKSDSTNAVTSDGIYSLIHKGTGTNSVILNQGNTSSNVHAIAGGYHTSASGQQSIALGYETKASGTRSFAVGYYTTANQPGMTALGVYNSPRTGDLFNIGNGNYNTRSNIVEVNSTELNVNGDIQINNVPIPIPYTTMPTITADMLGKIAMYVGATGNGYTQGCFYIASTDGAAEPTYSWVQIGGGTLGLEEVVLWQNDGTTNPDTITLSEAYTNFDEIVVYDGSGDKGMASNIYVQSVLSQNAVIGIIEDTERRIWYQIASPTTLNKADEDTPKNIALHSIVGRRYTKVSPTGYRQTVLWEYDPNTMQPGQNITLSDKFSNYDEIYFDPYYNISSVLQPTTRAGGSIYLSSLFADASDANRQYLSVNGVSQGTAEFCDFYYDGNVTLYAGAAQALWVGKIIGIKY